MQTEHDVRLTSAEISQLWSGYMGDSMSCLVLGYFLQHAEDQDVRGILEYALSMSEQHIQTLTSLFKRENFPIPHGFNQEDVNNKALRLYSDSFYLVYIRNMAKQGMALYALSLTSSARLDIRNYFTECLTTASTLYNKTVNLMQVKGLFIRPPFIPYPEAVEYVRKESFLNGFFGDKRPLSSLEITHLYTNILANALGKALIIGFAQVAQSSEVKDLFLRGKDIAHKQIDVFSTILRNDDVPSPMTWDSDVLDSTDPPFSDKLMMFHITGLNTAGILNYGAALAASMRRDLPPIYTRLVTEIGTYADDCAELMIKNGWLEKIPGAVDRLALANQ